MSNDAIDANILNLLSTCPAYVSGQQIARLQNLSRTAVWKRINRLREAGCDIDSCRNRGYRLVSLPDRLFPCLVSNGLRTTVVGRQIEYFSETDSTNSQAKLLFSRGAPDGTTVVTEHQTRGQGRLKRVWSSPVAKDLLFSILFYPRIPAAKVFYLTLLTSLAVCETLIETTGVSAGIKWPNDVYIGSRKICGILTEFSGHQDSVAWAVVGAGVNINSDPSVDPDLRDIATSLLRETGSVHPRLSLLQEILSRIDRAYQRFLAGEERHIRRDWLSHSIILGKPVLIVADAVIDEGIAEDIDDDGALLIRTDEGNTKRIVYGDLSLRIKLT